MFDFPASPSTGTIFSPAGGPSYLYDGQKWKVLGTGRTAQVRNRVVNPCMQISQENANVAGTTQTYYPADNWFMQISHGGTTTAQRVQSATPNGSTDRLRLTVTAADTSIAATDYCQMAAGKIEGVNVADFRYGSAAAKQSVLRFGWKSPAGTYAFSIINGATDRGYVTMFTISAAQANTDTVQSFIIPGDTTGTWATDNTAGFWLRFTIAAGTNYAGGVAGWQANIPMATSAISNGLGTVGAVFELFDVGLYLDPDGTGIAPPFQVPAYDDDMRACQRYWFRGCNIASTFGTRYGAAGGSTYDAGTVQFPVAMRTAPTAGIAVAPSYTNCSAAALAPDGNQDGGYLGCSIRVTVTALGGYRALSNATQGIYTFSARM